MAGHSNAKTTGLHDRRNDDESLDEVQRIWVKRDATLLPRGVSGTDYGLQLNEIGDAEAITIPLFWA